MNGVVVCEPYQLNDFPPVLSRLGLLDNKLD